MTFHHGSFSVLVDSTVFLDLSSYVWASLLIFPFKFLQYSKTFTKQEATRGPAMRADGKV